MEFNFPKKEGTGIAKLIPHVSPEAQEIICKLIAYNSDHRMSATQALKHAYFKELREADKSNPEPPLATNSVLSHGNMRVTNRGTESVSDNISDTNTKPNKSISNNDDKYRSTNVKYPHANSIKIDNIKNHTFNSDLEESPSLNQIGGTLPSLPPIFM